NMNFLLTVYAAPYSMMYIGDDADAAGRPGRSLQSLLPSIRLRETSRVQAPRVLALLSQAGAAAPMSKLDLFLPLTKVDADRRMVHGVATAEAPDRAGEICDYESTKPHFQSW